VIHPQRLEADVLISTLRALVRATALLIALTMFMHAGPFHGAHAQPKPTQSEAPRAGPPMPDALKMNMLIRTMLIALSQANATGNYSVLRDLGSPDFQLNNTQARLTDAFAELRRRKLDFSPVLFFDPKLVREPAIDDAGRLRLTGFIDTRPEQVTFDMMFTLAGTEWRLYGIAVEMRTNSGPAATQQQSAVPAASGEPAAKSPQPSGKAGSANRSGASKAPTPQRPPG
jgi:hypothetical protein